jgi:hypothetical protein
MASCAAGNAASNPNCESQKGEHPCRRCERSAIRAANAKPNLQPVASVSRVALYYLAHDRGDPDKVSRRVADSKKCDIEPNPRAIPPKALHVKNVVGAVVKHPTGHNAPVIAPMIGAFFYRNDKIERLPNGINRSMAKNALGNHVPLADYAFAIRRDHRMWAGR